MVRPGALEHTNTGRALLPRSLGLARGESSSNLEVLGRTAIAKALTANCAMSCSTAGSSTHWKRPRSWSRAGDATTTPYGLTLRRDTGRRHLRPWSGLNQIRWRKCNR